MLLSFVQRLKYLDRSKSALGVCYRRCPPHSLSYGRSDIWSRTIRLIYIAELVWGADPLERIGGFRALSYDDTATFDSSLGSNGSVQWQKVVSESVSNTERSAKATLSLTFQTLDVEFTSTVYGWAALQYQAWARGWLVNHASTPQTVEFFTDGVWEYSVNQQSIFGGDMYGLRKAPPVLTLNPGSNKIDLRIYRDIRAFGGLRNTPTVIDLEARTMNTTLLVEDSILISDKVDGKLPSPYASLVVRNLGLQKIEIESVDPLQVAQVLLVKHWY